MAIAGLPPSPVVTLGVDVSAFQHPANKPIDWMAVAASGRQFAIVKASDGLGTKGGGMFKTDYQQLKAAGMLRGGYHFYRADPAFVPADPGASGRAQAEAFLAQFTDKKRGDLFQPGDVRPVLDVEMDSFGKQVKDATGKQVFKRTTALTNAQIVVEVRQWLTTVEQALGIRPMIYTDAGSWAAIGSPDLTDHLLWLARVAAGGAPLPATKKPNPPKPWTSFALWQFSWKGRIPGIPAKPPLVDVDEDRFFGDLNAFRAALT